MILIALQVSSLPAITYITTEKSTFSISHFCLIILENLNLHWKIDFIIMYKCQTIVYIFVESHLLHNDNVKKLYFQRRKLNLREAAKSVNYRL